MRISVKALKEQLIYDDQMKLIGIHARNMIPERADERKYIPLRLLSGVEYRFPSSVVLYGLGQNMENIVRKKSAIIVESPKSVMQLETILDQNIGVGLFGLNMSKYKAQLLINLGVENVIIAI